MTAKRTLQPGQGDFEGIIRQEEVVSESEQPDAPLEDTTQTVSPSLAMAGNSASYPLRLQTDVSNQVQQIMANNNSKLPITPAVQKIADTSGDTKFPIAYAHSKLLLGAFGLEGINIANKIMTGKPPSSFDTYRIIGSHLTIPRTSAKLVREYIAAIFGPEILQDSGSADFTELSLDTLVDFSSLPTLLPEADTAFISQLSEERGLPSQVPFNSPYFIVMEMQPPETRLLTALTLRTAIAEKAIIPTRNDTFPYGVNYAQVGGGGHTPISLYKANQNRTLPAEIFQKEATKLGLQAQDVTNSAKAYNSAWDAVMNRIK